MNLSAEFGGWPHLALAGAAGAAIGVLYARRHVAGIAAVAKAQATRRNELAWELMALRNKGMHSARSVEVGRSFTARPTDVFVVTYPKCGTTWVTQIAHTLRCLARPQTAKFADFEGEITEVCPWDILAFDCEQNLDVDQVREMLFVGCGCLRVVHGRRSSTTSNR